MSEELPPRSPPAAAPPWAPGARDAGSAADERALSARQLRERGVPAAMARCLCRPGGLWQW
ncbi:hypothetical protein ACL02R_24520 [Streptomyces sp. MS19]|uniref:hypothetical protein n=1 Tax=Streptomyces sp. MS19 TaxID=3385972 RepID=UPI0039A16BAE